MPQRILTDRRLSVLSLTENTLNYDCPYGQVMSYEILRIVMIGYAKL